MRGLILAAGLGERLRPLTATRAKPALEFLNVPMLAFPYHWLNTLGLTDLTFNTHHLPDSVRVAAMHVTAPEVNLHFTHEPIILGAGGGIWNARFHLVGDRNFVVANGDAVVLFERPDVMKRMLAFHQERDALATILTCPLDGVGVKIPGVWTNPEDGAVTGFGKTAPSATDACLHYASFMIISERVWRDYPEGNSNILYDVLLPRLHEGVFAFNVTDMRWFETGNVRDYLDATEFTLREWAAGTALGQCAENLITRYAAPFGDRSDLSAGRFIADAAEVADSVTMQGLTVIGPEARVGENARIERGAVLPGAHLDPGGLLTNNVLI